METKQFIFGLVTAVVVFGAYFIGLFQGQRDSARWREFFGGMTGALTRWGFAWSLALPAVWVLVYYLFIGHVWFVLGRWPKFGEQLEGTLLTLHEEASRQLFGALVGSLYAVPVVLFGCLFVRRWR